MILFSLVLPSIHLIIIQNIEMENKPISYSDSPVQSEKILKKYHQLTSPLVSLQTVKKQDNMKNQLRQNVSMKLDCIKNRGSKIYALDTSISFSELKAGAALYQIPQFSVPQVNFQISDQIKKKVTEAKNQIISFFPEISKSSNYAPKKIEHQLNHRTVVRQLSQWLNDKLKNPPTNLQESIEYKNMIMGVGMKELIRIISKRCTQQGKMAEQIWELTWSICRQIILYLSNRAKKCEELLEQELSFMRLSYQKQYTRMTEQIAELTKKTEKLEAQNQQYQSQLSKLRKRKQNLEEENKTFSFDNFHLQKEMKKVLEENLAIYLQIGDKTKKGWIRKMYKNINALPDKLEKTVKPLIKQEITQVIEDRMKLQEVTGECQQIIPVNDIQNIGNTPKIEVKPKKYKKKTRKPKKSRVEKTAMMTMPADIENNVKEDQQPLSDSESIFSEDSCSSFIGNMRQEFKPVDSYTQTQMKKLIDAYASTFSPQMIDKDTRVQENMLTLYEQIAINTEQIKEQVKIIKKKGKQNSKEESRSKDKVSKILTAPPLKQKTKQKIDKEKKGGLQIVQELKYYQQQPVISQEKNEINAMESSVGDNLIINGQKNQQTNLQSSTKTNNKINLSIFNLQASDVITNQKTRNSIGDSQVKSEIMKESLKKDINASQQSNPSNITISNKLIGINFNKNLSYKIDDSEDISKEIHSTSIDSFAVPFKTIQNKYSLQEKRNQCIAYICAQCNKVMNEQEQKFLSRVMRPIGLEKNDKSNVSSKKSVRVSPSPSFINRSPQARAQQPLIEDKHSLGLMIRKEVRKNSSYIHDISYKRQLQQQQIPVTKNPYYSSKDQIYDRYDESIEDAEAPLNNLTKIPSYLLFYQQIEEVNKAHFASVSGTSQQTTENLEQYLQLVKQINNIHEGKISMNEKSIVSTIQKNVFPIMNQLLLLVKKAIKTGKILEAIRNFTSLPNIIYNRITRKYGVKILAIKNLKILLMALRTAGKYTDKYKIIELMMFTDCKSPHSEDFFMYLFIMALFDPNFSANKTINSQQLQTVKSICEQYLSKQPQIYNQVQKTLLEANLQIQQTSLSTVLKSIITNYRIFKINRIQDIGFIYLMLKSNHHVNYKRFIYFLSSFGIDHKLKVQISKKLLQFCDIKTKDQKIAISQIMFSKFLMNCEIFTFKLLEQSINTQIDNYKSQDHEIVNNLSYRFFKTEKYIQTKYQLHENHDQNASMEHEQVRQSISIVDSSQGTSFSKDMSSLQTNRINQEKILDKITVLKQIKDYSPFSGQICSYLQNVEETKHLTQKQQQFIKNYLIVHIIQSEIQKTLGLVDYFSTSVLDTLRTPTQDYILLSSKKN